MRMDVFPGGGLYRGAAGAVHESPAGAAGLGIWLLNLLLMRGCAGFSAHLLGEAAGSMALAALAAALACALGEMSIRRRIRTKPQARQYQGFFH